MIYSGPSTKAQYDPIIRAIDRIHGLNNDDMVPTKVVKGAKTSGKGGHFNPNDLKIKPPGVRRKQGESSESYYARRREARRAQIDAKFNGENRGHAEILINNRGDGTDSFSFVHEYGHRTDFIRDPHERGGGRYVSESLHKESSGVRGAFTTFFEATQTSQYRASVDEIYRRVSANAGHTKASSYKAYFTDVKEVWARAYSQYISGRLGGEVREGFNQMMRRNPHFQWDSNEFDAKIGPAVEGVLRARGLML